MPQPPARIYWDVDAKTWRVESDKVWGATLRGVARGADTGELLAAAASRVGPHTFRIDPP